MTVFSRVLIDSRRRSAARVLASLERQHAVIERALDPDSLMRDGDAPRSLWRLDPGRRGHPCRLYIVSEKTPGYVGAMRTVRSGKWRYCHLLI